MNILAVIMSFFFTSLCSKQLKPTNLQLRKKNIVGYIILDLKTHISPWYYFLLKVPKFSNFILSGNILRITYFQFLIDPSGKRLQFIYHRIQNYAMWEHLSYFHISLACRISQLSAKICANFQQFKISRPDVDKHHKCHRIYA